MVLVMVAGGVVVAVEDGDDDVLPLEDEEPETVEELDEADDAVVL